MNRYILLLASLILFSCGGQVDEINPNPYLECPEPHQVMINGSMIVITAECCTCHQNNSLCEECP